MKVITSGYDGTVCTWDPESIGNEPLRVFNILDNANQTYLSVVACSPCGKFMAGAVNDNLRQDNDVTDIIRVWKAETNEVIHNLSGQTTFINSVLYSPCGKFISGACSDTIVYIWNSETGENVYKLSGHEHEVASIVYSPCGQFIASCSADGTIRVWNTTNGKCNHVLNGHTNEVTTIDYSPCGQFIVSGSEDETIRVWQKKPSPTVQTAAAAAAADSDHPMYYDCIHILKWHNFEISCVAYSPCGQFIVSCYTDYDHESREEHYKPTINIWDMKTDGQPVYTINHDQVLNFIVYSPCGKFIYGGSQAGTFFVWDAKKLGKCIRVFEGHHSRGVDSIAFAPMSNKEWEVNRRKEDMDTQEKDLMETITNIIQDNDELTKCMELGQNQIKDDDDDQDNDDDDLHLALSNCKLKAHVLMKQRKEYTRLVNGGEPNLDSFHALSSSSSSSSDSSSSTIVRKSTRIRKKSQKFTP